MAVAITPLKLERKHKYHVSHKARSTNKGIEYRVITMAEI